MDSRGLYFGGGNDGLATVLPRESRGDFFDIALQDKARKEAQGLRAQQAKAKRRQADIDKIKNFDSWRHYSPSLKGQWDEVIEFAKQEDYDPVEFQSKIQDIAQLSKSSLQMKDEFKEAKTAYKTDKKVVGAEEWYVNKYHSNASIDNLRARQEEGAEPYAFLEEPGGSQYINPSEAFKGVIESSFKDFVMQKDLSGPTRKYIGRGLQQISQQEFEAKFRNFAQFNESTGEIEVKDIDQLLDDGILSVFMDDPYTARILEDEAVKLAGKNPVSDEHRAQVLKQQLSPRTSGTVDRATNIKTAREAVDFAGGRARKLEDSAKDWLARAKGGDKTAWDELIQTDYQGHKIQDVQISPVSRTVRLVLEKPVSATDEYGDKIEGTKTEARVIDVPYSTMSDEGLLGFYGQALKRPKGSRVNDPNRPSSEFYFDKIGINGSGELN